jgi:integrator complex subunit 1
LTVDNEKDLEISVLTNNAFRASKFGIMFFFVFPTDLTALHEFQKNVSVIQRDAVWWLHTVVPKMFNATGKDFLTW